MFVLLPPSETKRDGGVPGSSLDPSALSFPALAAPRRRALAQLRAVSRSVAASTAALGLGPTQRGEIARNRAISTSPTMPAIERYTGVLYDGLAAEALPAEARAFLTRHVAIQSALFGLLMADDPIPAYRFSHDARLPGVRLPALWRGPLAAELDRVGGLVLDLRSEAYVAMGAAPQRPDSVFLRVVSRGPDGARRALNHFNKKGKGEFTRALALAGIDHPGVESLLAWAVGAGIRLTPGAQGELDLEV